VKNTPECVELFGLNLDVIYRAVWLLYLCVCSSILLFVVIEKERVESV
jgi:hypothetical protein